MKSAPSADENNIERKPHVAIVCRGLGADGSVGDVALHHAQELSHRFQITLISDSFPDTLASGVELATAKTPTFRWLRRFAHVPVELAFAYGARRALLRRHTLTPFNALICHGHVAAHLTAQPFGAVRGVPWILVTHGDIFERPVGTYDSRLTWLYRKVTPSAYQNADLVIALSPPMRDLAIRSGAAQDRVVVIPNGIDPRDIGIDGPAAPRAKASGPTPVILYVGRLSPEKGIDTLVEACALLRDKGLNFRLDVYGDGPLHDSCRLRVVQSRLDNCAFFHGPVPRKLLGDVYRKADVVCVPSRSDTHPAVVLEAMITATPLVGCASGGIPFLVGNLSSELLVPPGDAPALADRLAEFIADPKRRAAISERLHLRASKEFSWKLTGQQLSRHINTLLASSARQPSPSVERHRLPGKG